MTVLLTLLVFMLCIVGMSLILVGHLVYHVRRHPSALLVSVLTGMGAGLHTLGAFELKDTLETLSSNMVNLSFLFALVCSVIIGVALFIIKTYLLPSTEDR